MISKWEIKNIMVFWPIYLLFYHVSCEKSHFFRAKNGLSKENLMSPESEPRLMWLPIVKIFEK